MQFVRVRMRDQHARAHARPTCACAREAVTRFQHPLKASKPSKPSQQLSTAFRCFAMGPPEAPRAVSVGLRNCYLALPKRHKMSGTFSAPLKTFKGLKPLPAAFDGLSLLCHWVSKMLSDNPEAPQAVSIGLQNCYLARFQHPLKPSKALKPSQQLSTAFRGFAVGPPEAPRTVSVGLRNCYLALPKRHKLFLYWASKLLSGTFSAPSKTLKALPAAFDGLRLLCHGTSQAPQAVSIGLRNCYLARCSFRRPFAALPWDIPRPTRHELFLLGFETPIWHVFSTP